jgi:hypothetical protein
MAVQRHQECIAELLQESQKAKALEYALTIEDDLKRCFARVNKISDACDAWLTDSDDPSKYTLDARSGDIEVIYEDFDGEYPSGAPKSTRKRDKLSTLLDCVTPTGRKILLAESKYSDPRKLVLDSANTLNGAIDRLAKLTGAYQEKRENERDKLNNREILVEALYIIYNTSDQPKTREEIVIEVDDSLRAVNNV